MQTPRRRLWRVPSCAWVACAVSWSEYYCRWFRAAVLHLPDWIDFWSGIVGGPALAAVRHYLPSVDSAVPDLEWQLLLWTLLCIFGVRFVLAPYTIAKEDAEKIYRQQREIDELQDRLKPRLVILGVVYETEPSQAISFPNIPCIREAKIQVRNTGAEILRGCLVKLENLTSDAWHQHKWGQSVLKTGQFTLLAGEDRLIDVARLDEKVVEQEIMIQFESAPPPVPWNDTYYFDIVAYSESPPDSKKFKLYVDDGRLTMEEST